MKLNLKMIAAAAAFAAAGSAQADLVGYNTGNGSLSVYAFNTVTRAYYIRDLGLLMNSFIPDSVTPLVGDNGGIPGTATPESGLNLSWSDASFSTWLTGQNTANIRWALSGGDSLSAGANGVSRAIISVAAFTIPVSNGTLSNYVPGSGAGNLPFLFGINPGISTTQLTSTSGVTNMPGWADGGGLLQASTLATLDQGVGLYYFARTQQGGATATPTNSAQYANSLNAAVVTLASNGDFTYALAPAVAAVPLPASIWLMGAGLAAVGGMVRRRKAAAQA